MDMTLRSHLATSYNMIIPAWTCTRSGFELARRRTLRQTRATFTQLDHTE